MLAGEVLIVCSKGADVILQPDAAASVLVPGECLKSSRSLRQPTFYSLLLVVSFDVFSRFSVVFLLGRTLVFGETSATS